MSVILYGAKISPRPKPGTKQCAQINVETLTDEVDEILRTRTANLARRDGDKLLPHGIPFNPSKLMFLELLFEKGSELVCHALVVVLQFPVSKERYRHRQYRCGHRA